jgi:chromosomal replication initiation ATPase DnaA
MLKELQATCTYYGIKPEVLKGKSRQRELVKARKIFSNLAIQKYGFGHIHEIAEHIGRHESICYFYYREVFNRQEKEEINAIKKML